jgi:hypothetical protein
MNRAVIELDQQNLPLDQGYERPKCDICRPKTYREHEQQVRCSASGCMGVFQEREAMDRYFVITFSDHPKLRADSRQSIETGEAALAWQTPEVNSLCHWR